MADPGLLAGVRVVDLTRALAGPLCTALLSDFGAEVIKVEPSGGDPTRSWPPFQGEESLYFASVNRGKKSVAFDLRSPEGRSTLRRLVGTADVLVENFRPGVLDAMGLAPEVLRREEPDLVIVSISGFGHVGPESSTPGLDQIAQGMSGLMSVTGYEGQDPLRVGVPIVDTLAGVYAALAAVTGLAARLRGRGGSHLQTSLLEAAISATTFQAQRYLSLGEVAGPAGNEHPAMAPYGVFRTVDDDIIIAVGTEQAWVRLCQVVGATDLPDQPRYRSARDRSDNRRRLREDLERHLARHGADHWIAALRSAGVPCGPIHGFDKVFADPQVEALGMVHEVPLDDGGSLPLLRGPFWVDGVQTPVQSPPPRRPGQDNDDILGALPDAR